MKRFALIGMVALGLMAAAAPSAQAAQITGSLSLSAFNNAAGVNAVYGVNNAGVAVALNLATALDFNAGVVPGPTPNVAGDFQVDTALGDFGLVGLQGTTGSIKDFSFAGAPGVYPFAPIVAFEAGAFGFSFDLTSVVISFQAANGTSLVLDGTGMFHLAGFDDTPGTFTFTITNQGTALSFNASETANPAVPEPGSMLLLGTGLVGLATVIRRRAKK